MVSDSAIEGSILPTAPSSTIYGIDTTPQDTPRTINQITKDQFENTNIQGLNDQVYYAPNVTQWGGGLVSQSPIIRGQGGAVYTNGIINAAAYQESIPYSGNAYESADIVSGPATVIYGPSPYTSGYVNYTTKQPYFDKFQGSITLDFGKWVSGGQGGHPDFTQTLDFGGPIIKDELAYRVSLQKKEADSYYDGATNNFDNVYTALTWIPNKDVTIDWNLDYGSYSYAESSGINRVNQELLDHGTYLSGTAVSVSPGSELYTIQNPVKQKIYGYETLVNPDSPYYAVDVNSQLKTTVRIDDEFKVVNTTAFEHFNDHKVDYVGFYKYLDSNYLENKTEFQTDKKYNVGQLDIEHQADSGLDVRYEQVDVDWDISLADLQAYDLKSGLPINSTSIQGAPTTPYSYHNTPANIGSTYESTDVITGLFTQHNFKFDDQWAFTSGYREDVYAVSVYDPLTGASDSSAFLLPSLNESLSYKPVPWVTTYLTFDYSQNHNIDGGPGWNYLTSASNETLNPKSYHSDSLLYEAGAKFELIKNKLFANIAGFYQERQQYDSFTNSLNPLEVHGIDTSLRYQPDNHFSTGVNFSWQNAHYIDYNPQVGSFNGNGMDGSTPFGNIYVTNIGHARGDYRVPWVPMYNTSAFAQYKFDNGFGFSTKLWATSSQNLDYTGLYKIRPQYSLDFGAFYDKKQWRFQIDFLNVTDERNYIPVYGGAVDTVTQLEPFAIQGRIVYRF